MQFLLLSMEKSDFFDFFIRIVSCRKGSAFISIHQIYTEFSDYIHRFYIKSGDCALRTRSLPGDSRRLTESDRMLVFYFTSVPMRS